MTPEPASPLRPVRGRLSRAARLTGGVGAFYLLDASCAVVLRSLGWLFPSSVAGMLVLFAALSVLEARNPAWAERLARAATPAVSWLTRWLALFFVPPLVMLPLAPRPAGWELVGLALLMGGGFLLTLVTTAWLARGLERTGRAVVPVVPVRAPHWSIRVVALGGLAVLGAGVAWSLQQPHPESRLVVGVALTVSAFAVGQLVHRRLQAWGRGLGFAGRLLAGVSHPVVVAAVVTFAGWTWLGWSIELYRTAGDGPVGPGDLLMALLNPAVVALGGLLYEQRALLRARMRQMLATSAVAAVLSLFATAFGTGFVGLSPGYARAMIPRSVTTPIAIPIADLLGADPGLTAAIVVVTGVLGALVGPQLLDRLRIVDPSARGLAIGASSHGIGTAVLVQREPAAAAVSGLAFALMAAWSAIAVSLPTLQRALLALAT